MVSVVAFLVVIIEGCVSDTLSYVSNVKNIEDALQQVDDARHLTLTIRWKVECYHKETHTETVRK